jgi:homoserine kinase
VLPKTIPLHDAVKQTANVALLVTAIHRGDVPMIGAAMERDAIVEPARQHLMPGLRDVRAAAKAAGAFGTIISGAGPTLCSICDSEQMAQRVAAAMQAVYTRMNLRSQVMVTRPAAEGVRVRIIE